MTKFIHSNPKTPSDIILCQIPNDQDLITIMEQEYVAVGNTVGLEICTIFVLLNPNDKSLVILGLPVGKPGEVYILNYDTTNNVAHWSKLSNGSIPHSDFFRKHTIQVSGNTTLDGALLINHGIDIRNHLVVTKTWEDLYKAIYR